MNKKFNNYMSSSEAAELANVDVRTIRLWCELNFFEAFKIAKAWIIYKKSFETFLKNKDSMKKKKD